MIWKGMLYASTYRYSIHMQRRNVYHTDQAMLSTSTQEDVPVELVIQPPEFLLGGEQASILGAANSEQGEVKMMKRRRTRPMRNMSESTCLKVFACSISSLIRNKQADSAMPLLATPKPNSHTFHLFANQQLPKIGHTAW